MNSQKPDVPEDLKATYAAAISGPNEWIRFTGDEAASLIERIAALTAELTSLRAEVEYKSNVIRGMQMVIDDLRQKEKKMIDWTKLHIRQEAEIVPQGISVTETSASVFIRVRVDDHQIIIKYDRQLNEINGLVEEFKVEASTSQWHGVWGTNG